MSDTVADPTTPNNQEWEDHSANVLSPDEMKAGASDAVLEGQRDAKANAKAADKENDNPYEDNTLDNKNIDDARETAELNHKTEVDAQPEQHELAKNDTTKAGKLRATKAQLDPSGEDPITTAELERAATDGTKVKGGTSVSNEEAARRAEQPGKTEEENPISTAHGNLDPSKLEATEAAKHANGNENKTVSTGETVTQPGSDSNS